MEISDLCVCAIGPHPDDIEFGAGGLIAKLAGAQACVHCVVVTTHPMVGIQRTQEGRDALMVLGVPGENIHFLNFEDGKLLAEDVIPLSQQLYAIFEEKGIDLVIGPSSDDAHSDHAITARAVKVAAKSRGHVAYHIFHHNEREPKEADVRVDISNVVSAKREAIERHRTEIGRGSITPERLAQYLAPIDNGDHACWEVFYEHRPNIGFSQNQERFFNIIAAINDDPKVVFWKALTAISGSHRFNVVPPPASTLGENYLSLMIGGFRDLVTKIYARLEINLSSVGFSVQNFGVMEDIIRNTNCIFIGGIKTNPWVHRYIWGNDLFSLRDDSFMADEHFSNMFWRGAGGGPEREHAGSLCIVKGLAAADARNLTIFAGGRTRRESHAALGLLIDPAPALVAAVNDLEVDIKLRGIQYDFSLLPRFEDDFTVPFDAKLRVASLHRLPAR